ncbi:peptidylprolyl isomerase [Vibrio sp. SCSIO 43136]|uniref:peptidylprolyl isomerase n=1 Tax=Vibrio sp. SCSIO 43136 TaxID=2819101 RepID=UPI002075EB6C|nr:peptidylprolyl isomerase [Vibrio sp. SCSIO 43136]USD64707.1 peptidyl-prolyl cis-trans isomerase [Vibrio sp. SCSIO 43136]
MRKFLLSAALLICGPAMAQSVLFETTLGDFTVELNQDDAPITVKNFLRYVEDGSYEGTIFHRVIPGFMAQGGGFNDKLERRETYPPIKNEASNGLQNKVATIAMARTDKPHTATRQFFINFKDNGFLDYAIGNDGYAVFGKVTQGFEVVESMATKPTTNYGPMQNVPRTPIVINKVTLQP